MNIGQNGINYTFYLTFMREIICNLFFLFINAYVIYFIWRKPLLLSCELWRLESEKKPHTFFFNKGKKIIQYFIIKKNLLFSLKLSRINNFFNDYSFFLLEKSNLDLNYNKNFYSIKFFDYWFSFLFILWLFLSFIFEYVIIFFF